MIEASRCLSGSGEVVHVVADDDDWRTVLVMIAEAVMAVFEFYLFIIVSPWMSVCASKYIMKFKLQAIKVRYLSWEAIHVEDDDGPQNNTRESNEM